MVNGVHGFNPFRSVQVVQNGKRYQLATLPSMLGRYLFVCRGSRGGRLAMLRIECRLEVWQRDIILSGPIEQAFQLIVEGIISGGFTCARLATLLTVSR